MPLADLFQAVADPTRLRLLALLREMELTVGELAQVLAQSQPRVSRHLKILADARLVERRKEGSWVFLQLGEPALVEALVALWDAVDDPVSSRQFAADRARLTAVRSDRAEAAARYFAAHAAEWDQIRSLHVADSEVEAAIREALGDAAIGQLVDIGTGTGRMIELFGTAATRSIGIDRSTENTIETEAAADTNSALNATDNLGAAADNALDAAGNAVSNGANAVESAAEDVANGQDNVAGQ